MKILMLGMWVVACNTLLAAEILPENTGLFPVRAFGAVGDGETKDTAAIQRAIDACHASGGGTVYFSPGTYLSGTVRLKDDVTLRLESGAVLKGSPDDSDYDPYEELGFKNDADRETSFFHHALIRGENVFHVAIEGNGTIDGNREKRGGPKPIALKQCQFVRITGITLKNAPNYNISLLGTDHVLIDGVTILNGYSDGIDPDSCRNVRIANCHIESADDAIVLKSSFSLGERRSCENVSITNCYLATVHNAFKCGTESGGDFKRITLSNCVMEMMPGGKRPATSGIALESVDGAILEDVAITNLSMVNVRCPVFLRLGNRGRDMETPMPGALRRVSISNIVASNASLPCVIAGIPEHPVESVTLSQFRVEFAGGTMLAPPGAEIPEKIDEYPDPRMFGALPSYALYARHAKDLVVESFSVGTRDSFWRVIGDTEKGMVWREPDLVPDRAQPANASYALFFDDVTSLVLRGIRATPCAGGTPVLRLMNTRDVILSGAVAVNGTQVFAEIAGPQSGGITLTANDLARSGQAVVCSAEVAPDAVREYIQP